MKGWCRQAPMKKGQQVRGSLTCSFLGIVCQREKIVVCSIPWQRKLRLLWQIWIHNQRSEKNAFVEEKNIFGWRKRKSAGIYFKIRIAKLRRNDLFALFCVGGVKNVWFSLWLGPAGKLPSGPELSDLFFLSGTCLHLLTCLETVSQGV